MRMIMVVVIMVVVIMLIMHVLRRSTLVGRVRLRMRRACHAL